MRRAHLIARCSAYYPLANPSEKGEGVALCPESCKELSDKIVKDSSKVSDLQPRCIAMSVSARCNSRKALCA